MAKKSLFDRTVDYDGQAYRNIVFLPEFQTTFGIVPGKGVFDDLAEEPAEAEAAAVSANRTAKETTLYRWPDDYFLHKMVISYPFIWAESSVATRFSAGSFAVWYGAEEWMTTIFETIHHMAKNESARQSSNEKEIVRHRMIYQVDCKGILADFRGKEKDFPELVGDDYTETHKIGRKVYFEGPPGIITPSARCRGMDGTCLAIFDERLLSSPRTFSQYTYRMDVPMGSISAYKEDTGGPVLIVSYR